MSRREQNENTKMNKNKEFTFNRGQNEMKRTNQQYATLSIYAVHHNVTNICSSLSRRSIIKKR